MSRGPEPRGGWRALAARAAGRPPIDDPLDPARVRGFWTVARVMAALAFVFDVGLWLGVRDAPQIAPRTLDAFAAINLSALAGLFAVASRARDRPVSRPALIAGIALTHLTVVVWIQVSGSLSSYFVVAGAMLIVAHRALLSWTLGLLSLAVLSGLHVGAFTLEELGLLERAPLFRSAPGPVYEAAAMRLSVMVSITSVYAMTWAGSNLLVATLRVTERALVAAERRLAAAAAGTREGRLTGQVVAGYLLQEVLGRGGMAEVYRGARAGGRAPPAMAIKVLHPYLVDDEHIVARVRREAEIAARLPGSVTAAVREVHLAGPGERVVVLDHLEGEDLAAHLRRRRRLPPDEAVSLLCAICRAVEQIHAAGVVHRDLKPHNLFLLDDGTVRVLDFGVARSTADRDELTRIAAVLGTPGYMAPEVADGGAAAAGPEVDVYALGVIAYQLLTGERPPELTASRPGERATPRPSQHDAAIPPELDAVVALAMARSPARRYRTAAAFAADLERAAAGTLPPEVVGRADADVGGQLDDTVVARNPSSTG